jgi:hypothetical protein
MNPRLSFLSAIVLSVICPAAARSAETQRVEEIIVVFKTHFDIGYTEMARDVVNRYRTTMIDQALEVVDKNRDLPAEQQFVWTLPGWPMHKILEDWDGQTPSRKSRIQKALQEGRFVVHGLPFTTHTELLEPEDLVRGLRFSSEVSRANGLPLPRDAKMTDVPCHSWFVPALLKNAGVNFLHLGCNSASSSPQVPVLFWWEGPDGSRLLTMYSASGYGTGLEAPKDWPYKTWLALFNTGDNHGPPRPEEVKAVLDQAARDLPGVKIKIGRLSDFADRIVAQEKNIPIIRGDMPDTWIHGPMCDPAGARLARNIRPAIGTTESLTSLMRLWGVPASSSEAYGKDVAARIRDARERSLLYGEHTWGGAFAWITQYGKDINWHYGDAWAAEYKAGRFKRLEQSWAEHTGYIEAARDLVVSTLDQSMGDLAGSVGVDGQRIVVFNPLPWKRNGVVSMKSPPFPVTALRSVDSGQISRASTENGTLQFAATELPAMGYRTYVPAAEGERPQEKIRDVESLENQWFRLSIDRKRGTLRSWKVKASDRELIDGESPQGFGQFLYERFDADRVASYVKAYVKSNAEWAIAELGKPNLPPSSQVPYQAASPGEFSVEITRNAIGSIATLHAKPSDRVPCAVTTRFILPDSEPWIEVELTLHDKPADPWPEAGWLCVPLRIASPQYRLGRLGSIIDPTRDIVPGANVDLMGVQTGVAALDAEGRGAALCAMDNPLMSFGRPGCWRYSARFEPERPTVYVNLFNNQWTTNFRLWNSGTWTSRVRVWAFDRFDPDSALITPSLESRYPLQAASATGKGGTLPPARTGLESSARGVMVTAFGPNADGQGTLLQLWDLAGQDRACRLRLPDTLNAREARPVNLRGESAGDTIVVKDGMLEVSLRKFAPVSVVIP